MIFARKGTERRGRTPEDLNVNVVNMIDVMMILISFLLMNGAVQTYSTLAAPDLIPPVSRSEDPVAFETEVAVTERAVLLDGEVVEGNFRDYEDGEVRLLSALDAGLKRKHERLSEAKGVPAIDPDTGLPSPGNPVIIKSDRKVLFKQIQKVMFTCNQAGFDKIEFAAIKEGT
ncbi:MAG: biopolymer transporter ExbD [Deltaproteobacteria bacterium]|nr:biopolymer transporter ExbD [Deltaproteobacteria bacterium]